MSGENFGDLMDQIKSATEIVTARNAEITGLNASNAALAKRVEKQDVAINALSAKMGRPGGGGLDLDDTRTQAIALLEQRHMIRTPRRDLTVAHEHVSTSEEIEEAKLADKGARALIRTGNIDNVEYNCRKSLTAFQVGSSGYLMPVEWSSRVRSSGRGRRPSAPSGDSRRV
jgi:hypothetical protein